MDTALPDPWRLVRTLETEVQDALEATVGSRLKYRDLTDEDVERAGDAVLPRSRRSMWVMGHRWVEIQNVDTDVVVWLRLQRHEEGGSLRVSSVIFPFASAHELSGADLRALPIAALNAAFTRHEDQGRANLRITFALGGDHPKSPLDKLPPADASDRFAALVALQYTALEENPGGENTAKALAKLNDVPLPSAQRWIARARKYGFLPPASPRSSRG